MSKDPSSLDRLNDIVIPDPAPLWPPAPGWILLAGLIFTVALLAALRAWRRHLRNAYRREALGELARMRDADPAPQAVSSLLKRVALATWPRAEVAGLAGTPWVEWLDDATNTPMPPSAANDLRDAFAGTPASAPPELLDYAEHWIERHREGPRC